MPTGNAGRSQHCPMSREGLLGTETINTKGRTSITHWHGQRERPVAMVNVWTTANGLAQRGE